MKDLTKIKLPLGMLSKKTQKRLKEAFESGDVVEWWAGDGWAVKEHGSTLYTNITYRKQPAPEPTKDEMKDLTKINTPFGLLSKKTQKRLVKAHEAGDVIDKWSGSGWLVMSGSNSFLPQVTYRLAEPTQDEIDWSHVSDDIVAIARNEWMTNSWLYTKAPTSFSSGKWVGGTSMGTTQNFASYKHGTCEAKDSLVLRPKGGA